MDNLAWTSVRFDIEGQMSFASLPTALGLLDYSLDVDFSHPYLVDCVLITQGNRVLGRFALYDNPYLIYDKSNAIAIGMFCCVNNKGVAEYLFGVAKQLSKALQGKILIGPMNGSTWDNYRVNTLVESHFFLDVSHPDYTNQLFNSFGFESIAEYQSNCVQVSDYDSSQLNQMEQYYANLGGIIRQINLENMLEEFKAIARFCNIAFAKNLLFTPIKEERFVTMYSKLAPLIDPNFVWIVEDVTGQMQALVFAIVDPKNDTTLILKTIAVKPNSPYKGIATFLSRKLMVVGKQRGIQQIIHALFIKDNLSDKASQRIKAKPLNTYTLYGLNL